MKKKICFIASVFLLLSALAYAEVPQHISFAGESYHFDYASSDDTGTTYFFKNEAEQPIDLLWVQTYSFSLTSEGVKELADIVKCESNEICYTEVCAKDDIVVQRFVPNRQFFLQRFNKKGYIYWHSFSHGEEPKAPLSTYRNAFCRLNFF